MVFGVPYPTRPSQRSRHLASRWRRPTPRSVRRSNPSHTTTCSSAVCDTRHRRAGAAPDLASSPTTVHAATSPHRRPRAMLPRCEVLDLRGSRPGRAVVVFQPAASSHTTKHPSARSRAHPQHARTHDHRAESVPQCTQYHARRSHSPRSSLYHRTHTATLSFMPDLARRSHCPRWSRSTHGDFLFFFRVPTLLLAGRSFFLLASHCAARHARPHARTFASPPTDDRRRKDDATCGPQAWLTGSLHDGGIWSVRSPLRRAPLLATPIAMPLQCGRP